MSKGTPSQGKHQKTIHIRCRRCGYHAFHKRRSECAHCGFPNPKIRDYAWKQKKPLNAIRKY